MDIDIGENSSFPHGSMVPHVFREGTLVLIDGGGRSRVSVRYQPHFRLRQSFDKMKKVFDIGASRSSRRPQDGTARRECQAVDAAARK